MVNNLNNNILLKKAKCSYMFQLTQLSWQSTSKSIIHCIPKVVPHFLRSVDVKEPKYGRNQLCQYGDIGIAGYVHIQGLCQKCITVEATLGMWTMQSLQV